MGLFSGLVMAPLAPVRGVIWVAERLAAHAESQQEQQAASVPARLAEVADALAEGQISAERAAALEEDLLSELECPPPAVPPPALGTEPS